MPDDVEIPLAAVVRALRRELAAAVEEGEDQEIRFALGTIELDLEVAVSSTGGGEAGIQFWVLSLGAKGERTSARTQTLRLKLDPVRGGKPVVVGSEQRERPR